ncbi:hypothetical protein [Roseobacter sp. CCS2]|uniref:hypothetical protein n=1 Tax=Roseobacter sp. CCS2 TaxID=391593 RepID=UPI0000F3FBD3|nr:hypothetical protein [Roseobacter sp. CCS2]EBA10937.1 hypothetical protein RCCS2_00607 [Roseobacter sp. CCS2]
MKAPPDRPKPKFFDLAVPFFLPVWRRVLTAVVPILWAMVELANGQAFWALIFFALGVTAIWKFYTADWAAVAAQAEKDARGGR